MEASFGSRSYHLAVTVEFHILPGHFARSGRIDAVIQIHSAGLAEDVHRVEFGCRIVTAVLGGTDHTEQFVVHTELAVRWVDCTVMFDVRIVIAVQTCCKTHFASHTGLGLCPTVAGQGDDKHRFAV